MANSEKDYSLVFRDFVLPSFFDLNELYLKAKRKYIDNKIKSYKILVNLLVQGGGFLLAIFWACFAISKVDHLETTSFLLYTLLVFVSSFFIAGFLKYVAEAIVIREDNKIRKTLLLKDNTEYCDAIRAELKTQNNIKNFLRGFDKGFFLTIFLGAKELLPEAFTKEVKELDEATALFYSLDGHTKDIVLGKVNATIDDIVKNQIEHFISLKIKAEETSEKVTAELKIASIIWLKINIIRGLSPYYLSYYFSLYDLFYKLTISIFMS